MSSRPGLHLTTDREKSSEKLVHPAKSKTKIPNKTKLNSQDEPGVDDTKNTHTGI